MNTFPGTSRAFCSTFVISNLAFICSGEDSLPPYYLNQLYEYNISNDQWTIKSSLPSAGRIAGAGFSIGNYGYVATGYTNFSVVQSDLWQYAPSVGTGLTTVNPVQISVYPNPVTESLHLDKIGTEVQELRIYHSSGKMVSKIMLSETERNNYSLQVNHLPAGSYLIEYIQNDNKIIGTSKFIKR
ncbi:MAG: hypothetical protein BWY67_01777 [Bacteroidetes bacterium ADurb.Bin397]|nr:MAG: hypothetical protein BWY67_01777 [Bacteroidetes bacterium ADurb.Bin397]